MDHFVDANLATAAIYAVIACLYLQPGHGRTIRTLLAIAALSLALCAAWKSGAFHTPTPSNSVSRLFASSYRDGAPTSVPNVELQKGASIGVVKGPRIGGGKGVEVDFSTFPPMSSSVQDVSNSGRHAVAFDCAVVRLRGHRGEPLVV